MPIYHSFTKAATSPGAQLRRIIHQHARVQKDLVGQVRPEPLEYTDWNSGECDSVLTPGGLGQVIGQNLKFDPRQPDQGIFFVTPEGNSHQTGIISHNTGDQLTFLVPISLTPGDYTLEVRTGLSQDVLRKGSLEATLTVS